MMGRSLALILGCVLGGPLLASAGWNPGEPLAARAAGAVPQTPDGFAADSAVIDHPYFPLASGEVWAFTGYGERSGELFLYTAGDVASADGVACLPVLYQYFYGADYTESFACLATDRSGVVWEVSNPTPTLFLWADLRVGDTLTYADGVRDTVTSLDAQVDLLRTGFGAFSGCMSQSQTFPDGAQRQSYHAPGTGLIKLESAGGGFDRVPLGQPQEGFGTLQFGAEVYDAVEEDGTFPVTVVRSGGSQEVVWVEFEVTGVQSHIVEEGAEVSYFDPDPKTVYLAPGQSSVIFDVAVLDNKVWNNGGTGTIELSSPGGGATLGERATATVQIEEGEAGEKAGTFIGPCFLDTLTSW
ncbi:MAG TPA: hypothetical protein VK997_15815 [Deferrisomatales bacterium]|nr:hypothetical protein [Deferrisomatales bacterium]